MNVRCNAHASILNFSRSLLRSKNFWLHNRAILRNAVRTTLPLANSEKHAAQHPEKLRKKPSLNYNSAALSGWAAGAKLGKNGNEPNRLFTFRQAETRLVLSLLPADRSSTHNVMTEK